MEAKTSQGRKPVSWIARGFFGCGAIAIGALAALIALAPRLAASFVPRFAERNFGERYRGSIDGHLVKAFGPLRIESLSPQTIQRWLTEHKEQHGPRRRIALAHAVLRSALAEAKRLQLVSINAAELVRVPKPQPRPIAPLTVDEAAAFLKAADKHRLGALFSVALACGLRLGEACGLRWEDVNLETGELQVRQQVAFCQHLLGLDGI